MSTHNICFLRNKKNVHFWASKSWFEQVDIDHLPDSGKVKKIDHSTTLERSQYFQVREMSFEGVTIHLIGLNTR